MPDSAKCNVSASAERRLCVCEQHVLEDKTRLGLEEEMCLLLEEVFIWKNIFPLPEEDLLLTEEDPFLPNEGMQKKMNKILFFQIKAIIFWSKKFTCFQNEKNNYGYKKHCFQNMSNQPIPGWPAPHKYGKSWILNHIILNLVEHILKRKTVKYNI